MNSYGPKGALQPTTLIAESAVVKGRALRRGAAGADTVRPAIANSQTVGIAVDSQSTAGNAVAVAHRPGECIEGCSGAAFALDAYLASDANGKLVTATTGQNVAAIAREAATAADQLVAVEIPHVRMLAP